MNDQAQVQGFDLSNLEVESGPAVHQVSVIDDLDGNPVSGFVIVGKNSPQYQKVTRDIRIANIKRASKRKGQIDASTDNGAEVIARTVEESDRMTALAVVTGWFGMMQNGQLMSFDKSVVEKMFKKYPQWQAKVLAALEDDANFTKG